MRLSWPSCARRARSSTRKRISTSTTPGAAILAAPRTRLPVAMAPAREARGAERPATRTTQHAKPAARAPDRRPAWRNDVVALVTTKGLIPYGGAMGADPYLDRAGIQCRTVTDTAEVLDALKDPERGYFDPRDIYTA